MKKKDFNHFISQILIKKINPKEKERKKENKK
jgi:hypothetical protein